MSWSDKAADAAWDALHPEAAPTPEVEAAAPEVEATPEFIEAAAPDLDDDGEISDLEATVFASILEGLGVDLDTATEEQVISAVEATDHYVDELRATVRGDATEQGHQNEVSEEQARTDAAMDWAEEQGLSYAEAQPYLERASQAVAAGDLSEDAALQIAADAVRTSQAADDVAHRETKYKGMGLSRGLDAAFDDVFARRAAVYEDSPSANNVVLGDAFDNALGNTLTKMSLETAHKNVARKIAGGQ